MLGESVHTHFSCNVKFLSSFLSVVGFTVVKSVPANLDTQFTLIMCALHDTRGLISC